MVTPGLSLHPPLPRHQPHPILQAYSSHPEICRNPVKSLLLWQPWDPKEPDRYPLTSGVNEALRVTTWNVWAQSDSPGSSAMTQGPRFPYNLGISRKGDPVVFMLGFPEPSRARRVQSPGTWSGAGAALGPCALSRPPFPRICPA